MLHPLNIMWVGLKVSRDDKMFYFSERALRAGTAPNMWLKLALERDSDTGVFLCTLRNI